MKNVKMLKIFSLAVSLVFLIIIFSVPAFAVDEFGNDDFNTGGFDTPVQNSEPAFENTFPYYEETEVTEYSEPIIQPTETYYEEPTTEYIEYSEGTDTTEPTEFEKNTESDYTQFVEQETTKKSYIDYFAGLFETTESPTQLSTSVVSTNTYSTNNNAGIVCWVCVIVGVITLVVMLASTKMSDM